MNVERRDWCLISSKLTPSTFTWSSCGILRSGYKCGFDWRIMSLSVHRAAARPTSGADIEAGLPGGGDIRGQLHVQPSAACCRYHVAGERQAGEYWSTWNGFIYVGASCHNYSWRSVRTPAVENFFGGVCVCVCVQSYRLLCEVVRTKPLR